MSSICLYGIKAVESTQVQLLEQVNTVQAQQVLIDTDYYALVGYFQLNKQRFNLSNTDAQKMGWALKRKSQELDYIVKKTHSSSYGLINTYHKDVLKIVLGF